MMNIGLDQKNCLETAKLLNVLLANEYVLYTKTWKFHWNVKGKQFKALHIFFDELRHELETIIDDVAERVRALDVDALGTLTEFREKTMLIEKPQENPDDMTMIQLLLRDHEEIIKKIRQDNDYINKVGDAGTSNFLCNLLEKHEKFAWMLKAHTL